MAVKRKTVKRKTPIKRKAPVKRAVSAKKKPVKRKKAVVKRKKNPITKQVKHFAAFVTRKKDGKRFYFKGLGSKIGSIEFTDDIFLATWFRTAANARDQMQKLGDALMGKTEFRKLAPIGGEEVGPKR